LGDVKKENNKIDIKQDTMKIIEIDSQILNSIQNCALKHELQFEENLAPEKKAEPLEKGDLLHKMLELYDGLLGKCYNVSSDTWCALEGQGFLTDFEKLLSRDKQTIVSFCIEAGQYFASKMEIDTETAASVIYQFKEYSYFYNNDPWSTLAVEEVASKVLFENSELKIIYSGKIDRFVEQGSIRAPMDHKSSSRQGSVSTMSNQFIGYCFLLDTNHIIIDKIGFQKTLKPAERFQRFILNIDDGRINEWKENSINYILNHLCLSTANPEEAHYYFDTLRVRIKQPLMNLTSCDKYSGCIYRNICESNPEGREWIKERDYIIREKWDVSAILEAKS